MPTSLEHGPKYKCRKINKGLYTLEMWTNGTRMIYLIQTIYGKKGEGKGLKEYITKWERLNS